MWETLIDNLLVRSTGDNLDLQSVSEVGWGGCGLVGLSP